MAHRKKRVVIFISNPAPEGQRCTSQQNADRFVSRGEAEWLDITTIRMVRAGEQEAIRLEMAARARRMGDEEVSRRIDESRYGRVSWHGGGRKGVAWYDRGAMVPLAPGMVRS